MVEIKLLGRVKYENVLYVANDVIQVDENVAKYLKDRNLCEVMAVIEPTKEEVKPIEEIKEEKLIKKSKKGKQEGK